jgi:uncharacterized repeat protein (TIGR03803 family)
LLQSFNGANGSAPNGLTQGTDGKFYGTTQGGGANGQGTFFSIVPGGTLVTLYGFCSQTNCADGYAPNPGLIQGTDGNFYGTTSDNAQANQCLSGGCGTVFKVTPTGTLTNLYAFPTTSGNPPYAPYGPFAGLVQGTDGNFYGTTGFGGNTTCPDGESVSCGTVFQITPGGTLTTLYDFCGQPDCPDGYNPSGLTLGRDGNFYGTTPLGGDVVCINNPHNLPCGGTVFKITPGGTLITLHRFIGVDGNEPSALVQGSDGNFYGITWLGGANNAGTIFRISPEGAFITLYSFAQTSTSASPDPDGLVQAANGTFYGTTAGGGANNDGTVFSFSIGLGGTTSATTTLGLSPATVSVGATGPVVMTATVAPTSGSGTPTGVADFFNGSDEIGFANLSGGVATFTYNPGSLALGTYQVTAIYSGDGTFATSTSSAETLTISSLPAAATPSFSPAAGSYNSAQTVTIADATAGTTIYFTDDGTIPTTSSEVYNGPITVSSTETLNAIAASSSYLSSAVASATYTITLTPDYQLSVTPSTLTIVAGQSGTANFTVTPMNGFNSQVSFACSGLPSGATCSFTPASVTPSAGNPVSSTLIVSTTAASAALGQRPFSNYRIYVYALFLPFGVTFSIAFRGKPGHRGLHFVGVSALLVLAAGLTSCGSSSIAGNPGTAGTPPGTSTATVTASTSGTGAINHTIILTITITQ